MARGGSRRGAGRKSNADLDAVRVILDQFVSSDDWEAMLRAAVDAAKRGNMRALEILLGYRYGKPTIKVAADAGGEQIRLIVAHPPDMQNGTGRN